MPVEQLISLAERRNITIPGLIRDEKVYWEAEPFKTLTVQGLCHAVVPGIWAKGLDNLATAAGLVKNGEDVTEIGNHLCDGDHSARRHAFNRFGFQDFGRKLVFMAGLKMIERWPIKWFMPAESVIFIPTPFDFNNIKIGLKDLIRQSREGLISPTEYDNRHELIEIYAKNLGTLNEEAKKLRARIPQEGKVICVYPEATRSLTGFTERAAAKVIDYAPESKSEAYIFPVMLWGMEKFNPPNKNFRLTQTALHVVAGKPFKVGQIWEQAIDGQTFQGKAINRADVMMAYLGKLAPEMVNPYLREFYSRLAEGYDPEVEKDFQYFPGAIEQVLSVPFRLRNSLFQPRSVINKWE